MNKIVRRMAIPRRRGITPNRSGLSGLFHKFSNVFLLNRVRVLLSLDSGFRRNDGNLGLFVIPAKAGIQFLQFLKIRHRIYETVYLEEGGKNERADLGPPTLFESLVPGAGIEPARDEVPRDFKSLASAYSATQAQRCRPWPIHESPRPGGFPGRPWSGRHSGCDHGASRWYAGAGVSYALAFSQAIPIKALARSNILFFHGV
jgi:hypothetical protein